jgi:SAM-dependent methyltransferase
MPPRLIDPVGAVALRGRPGRTGLLTGGDGRTYPVLGDVPILVPDPSTWCRAHHDAVVATLAATGRLDDDALALLAATAALGDDDVDPAPFVDDFTPEEIVDAPPPRPAHRGLAALVDDAAVGGPLGFVVGQLARPEHVLELGPGAGGLTSLLGASARRQVWTLDISLRAVALGVARGGPKVRGVVADATAIPFADAGFDLVVAMNVVDVVAAPTALVREVARVLAPGGRFVLTTPAPSLHTRGGDDRVLERALRAAGLVVDDVEDGILWPRVHGTRHVELWVCRGIVASKPATSTKTASKASSATKASAKARSSTSTTAARIPARPRRRAGASS